MKIWGKELAFISVQSNLSLYIYADEFVKQCTFFLFYQNNVAGHVLIHPILSSEETTKKALGTSQWHDLIFDVVL